MPHEQCSGYGPLLKKAQLNASQWAPTPELRLLSVFWTIPGTVEDLPVYLTTAGLATTNCKLFTYLLRSHNGGRLATSPLSDTALPGIPAVALCGQSVIERSLWKLLFVIVVIQSYHIGYYTLINFSPWITYYRSGLLCEAIIDNRYTRGDSDVILSAIVTAAVLEIYCVAALSRKLAFACKLRCVELHTSRNILSANTFGVLFVQCRNTSNITA